MSKTLTLPDLEDALNALQPGEAAKLARDDFERLFGLNDAAQGRLMNFATHHNCATTWVDQTLHFRKRPPAWDDSRTRAHA